jgi:small subunit ribosomal protein S15
MATYTRLSNQETIKKFGKSAKDSGSSEVQIALLTGRIKSVASHLESNVKDHHSRFGLVTMVNQRKRLLRYLSRTNHGSYLKLIEQLGLRK